MKKSLRIIILIVFILILAIGSWMIFKKSDKISVFKPIEKNETAEAINGTLIDPAMANRRPFAVMVENHPDARPQSGLDKADRVYETLAEGGITRFMAIYQTQEVSQIGPVRSSREYYADIANELGAVYAHVGGSDEVLNKLSRGGYPKLFDANQYFLGDYFRRISSRPAPHNVYTSTKELQNLVEDKKIKLDGNFQRFTYQDFFPNSGQLAHKATIKFSTPSYDTTWEYNPKTDDYTRTQGKLPHLDKESGEQLRTRVVVIQYVKSNPIPGDEKARITINTTSGGKSLVLQGGHVYSGTWKKTETGTVFLNDLGEQQTFKRGPMWVMLVPNDIERVNLIAPQTTNTENTNE